MSGITSRNVVSHKQGDLYHTRCYYWFAPNENVVIRVNGVKSLAAADQLLIEREAEALLRKQMRDADRVVYENDAIADTDDATASQVSRVYLLDGTDETDMALGYLQLDKAFAYFDDQAWDKQEVIKQLGLVNGQYNQADNLHKHYAKDPETLLKHKNIEKGKPQ